MTTSSWIRAEDGDWYRVAEVVAVKTLPHPEGGFMVTVETHRHDNVDVTGRLETVDVAESHRDRLARLLLTVEEGSIIAQHGDGFAAERVR